MLVRRSFSVGGHVITSHSRATWRKELNSALADWEKRNLYHAIGCWFNSVSVRNLYRKFIGVEIDVRYFGVAEKRLNKQPTKLFSNSEFQLADSATACCAVTISF